MDYTLFVLSFASVSFLPGLCMNLALSLGLSIGFKKTLWMMAGELFGLLLVVVLCGLGASFVLQFKPVFMVLKLFGSLFLLYTAYTLFHQKLEFKKGEFKFKDKSTLALQGFLATISNPKAWIFMLALLPPFLQKSNLLVLSSIIIFIEFVALCTYALGGVAFGLFLGKHLNKLSKFSALCVAFLGCFMLYELFFELYIHLSHT